jgi:hypothetical protein
VSLQLVSSVQLSLSILVVSTSGRVVSATSTMSSSIIIAVFGYSNSYKTDDG